MNATFELDAKVFGDFREAIRDLHATSQRDLKDIVDQQARLTVFDCIKTTPPNGKAPIQESFSVQKKAGEQAIMNDVDRLYEPLDKIKALVSPKSKRLLKHSFDRWAAEGNWKAMSEMLFAIKVTDRRRSIVGKAEFSLQRQIRGSRGRISPRFKDAILVADKSSIALIKNKLRERVGWAKDGWGAAVKALGVKGIPGWISRHGAPGSFRYTTTDKSAPSLEFTNDVRYIDYLNKNAGILERALKNRVRAMEISCEKAVEYWCEKFNSV